MKFMRASHFGPTLLVTTLAYLFSRNFFSFSSALLIALTIFTGQLLVGWTNDLVDFESDLQQDRREKPLVVGDLTVGAVRRITLLDLPLCVALSLFGPLGLKGGALHLLGVGCGVAYNFHFKNTVLSPIPYAIAFACLPITPFIAAEKSIPTWMFFAGAIFGVVAHFANVLKDLESDRDQGNSGLPQLMGAKVDLFICIGLLGILTIVLGNERAAVAPYAYGASLTGAVLIAYRPKKLAFPVIMALALLAVLAVAF